MTARAQRALCIAVIALCVAACNSPEPETPPPTAPEKPKTDDRIAEWPAYHGDAALAGFADIHFGDALSVAWRYDAGASVINTPVSDAKSRLLCFTDDDGVVHALDWDGQPVWSKALTQPGMNGGPEEPEMFDAPLRIANDTVIAGGAYGTVYALGLRDGNLRWKTETDATILGSPNVVSLEQDGARKAEIVFIDQSNGALHALDLETGNPLWSGEGPGRCDGSPAANASYIVFGSCASALHIHSPANGSLLREVALGQDEQVAGGVVLLGDSIYSSTRSGRFVHANAATGELVWSNVSSEEEALWTPAVSAERVVFCDESAVYALNRADGTLVWRQEVDYAPSTPIIVGDKVAVAASGTLVLLALADGHLVTSRAVSDEITSPGVAGTRLVTGGDDGVVTAFDGQEGS